MDAIYQFFSEEGFSPHGFCLTWRPDVFWTMAVSDALIALSYFSIPVALFYFLSQRKKIEFRWIGVLFALFIIACGLTHVLDIWTLWVPDYAIAALAKALTAAVSLPTAMLLWMLMPAALALPTRLEVEQKNRELVVAQAALRESEKRYRGLVETQHDLVVRFDPHGCFTFINDSMCRIIGRARQDLIGTPWQDVIHRDDIDQTVAAIVATLDSPDYRAAVENRLLTATGERWYGWEGYAIVDESGTLVELQAVGRDITERKKHEEGQKDQVAFLHSLFEAIPAVAFFKDINGRYLGCNRRFEQFFGIPSNKIIGHTLKDVLPTDENLETYFRSDKMIFETGQPHTYAFTQQLPDERDRHARGHKAPLFKSDGSVSGLVGIILDITADIERENELRLARAAAEEANRAKTAFLANMSHEIRTPMNAILGLTYLLERTNLQPSQRDYLQKTRISAQSLLGIINDILDFSKVEAGKIELTEEPFALYDLMKTLATVAAANAREKNIEVLFLIDPKTPLDLIGDHLRLQQILTNLASNAIKFTERGEVVLSVTSESCDHQTVRLCFDVRDSGIGIATEYLSTIFDPFSQGDTSTTRRYGGTGLGLTICHRLVALMGGEISVDSKVGCGSIFKVSVPLRYQPSTHATKAPETVPKNLKVLVVDDNATARQVMATMIEPFGWTVVLAASGQEALAAFDQAMAAAPFDLLLLDWCMPDIGGRDIVRHVHNTLAPDEVPVILVVTAFQFEQVMQDTCGEPSIPTVLTKPVTPSLLLDAVAVAFRRCAPTKPSVPPPQSPRTQLLSGLTLLVVEDNSINQMVARKILEGAGAAVVLAGNGSEALARLAIDADRFDAVLMDIQMPGMDGYEVTQMIREKLGFTDLPVIAMTASALPADRERCLAAGMVEHIGKPFEVEPMIAAIARNARQRNKSAEVITVAAPHSLVGKTPRPCDTPRM